jgi:uncharacterized protein (TIGR02453 family)
MTFSGFPPELFDFYAGLEADNSRVYWQSHKHTYEMSVQAPMEELASALEDEFGQAHLYRPHRDLRFTKDKRPYQEYAAFSVDDGSGGGYYLSISTEGLHLGGGYWKPARDQLERWRRAVDDPPKAGDLESLLRRLDKAGFPLQSEMALKTVPRGYDRDHPRGDLLRRTSLTVGRRYEAGPELQTPGILTTIREGWRHLREWGNWLRDNVGPSGEPNGRRHG